MTERTAVLIGATGLVGSHLLNLILEDDYFTRVRVLGRRPIEKSSPKIQFELVDFDDLTDYARKLGSGDCIFCCVGTTTKKVQGNKEAYRKVDYDIPVNAAKIGSANGFRKYILISAVGANANSSNFYLKLKGETENAIRTFHFDAIQIFRPSLIVGKRKERRPAERLGMAVMQGLSFLMVGGLSRYHPIRASDLAEAILRAAKNEETGFRIKEHKDF